jgi:hypothetical protein
VFTLSDLGELITELTKRKMSRKQFMVLVGGSFLGMIGFFRVLQAINTPDYDLAHKRRGVFGEMEYGYPGDDEIKKAQAKGFSQDAFG